ncbi:UNVERIFIED_CONTAM: Copia protein [Sesamum angustifolium]|uniref:Copia protein n=1 Tax=Sesamum angustifolium TaxID=2727405 RepID=A0AAW2L544_9LAMI
MKSHDVAFWKEAVNDEMDSIMGNNTWVLVNLPPSCKPLGCKWIFKKKMKVDGTIEKFNARLVIQSFRQRPGIDYFDIYAPIARIATIRLLIALASIHNLVIHQMDVKTAFPNGDLDKEVYMKQPEGFIIPGNEYKVRRCRVHTCLELRLVGSKIERRSRGLRPLWVLGATPLVRSKGQCPWLGSAPRAPPATALVKDITVRSGFKQF